jgi:hypothetical protein
MTSRAGFNEINPNAANPGIMIAIERHRVETTRDFLRIVRIANAIRFG